MSINHFTHLHQGGDSQANIGIEFNRYNKIRLHSLSFCSNFKNISESLSNNLLHLDLTSTLVITLDDGFYTIQNINDKVLENQPYKFKVSTDGLTYRLYQYPSLTEKATDVNGTEIVGYQAESQLNLEIYNNELATDRIKLQCNILPNLSNDHQDGTEVQQ
jgi:hypothetical protein